jgi:hypothetical protein
MGAKASILFMPQCQLCGYDSDKVYHTDANETICEKCCSSLKSYAKKADIIEYIGLHGAERITTIQDFHVLITAEGEIMDNIMIAESTSRVYLLDGKAVKGNLIIAVAKKLKLIH